MTFGESKIKMKNRCFFEIFENDTLLSVSLENGLDYDKADIFIKVRTC